MRCDLFPFARLATQVAQRSPDCVHCRTEYMSDVQDGHALLMAKTLPAMQ